MGARPGGRTIAIKSGSSAVQLNSPQYETIQEVGRASASNHENHSISAGSSRYLIAQRRCGRSRRARTTYVAAALPVETMVPNMKQPFSETIHEPIYVTSAY